MTERFFSVDGTRILADIRGRDDAPVLLYIHGGPGMGCWDFMRVQGDRLAEHFRLVGVDQRGVLRSDALAPGSALTVATLIADFEAIRRELGVERWSLLGHSAGAAYALDYAVRHPAVVDAVVFDSPSFDVSATDRHRLPAAAAIHDELGNTEQAERCRRIAAAPDRITLDTGILAAAPGLGDRFDELFFRRPDVMASYHAARQDSGFADADWAKGGSHRPVIEELYARPRLPELPRLSAPSALLHGSHDLVASPDQVAAYREVVGGPVVTLPESGHFGQLEAPEEYAAAVIGFARDAA